MILSDRTVRSLLKNNHLKIDPFNDDQIQPASVDVRLGCQFRRIVDPPFILDPFDPPSGATELMEFIPGIPFILYPGEFMLATTMERFSLPNDIVARVEGKSGLGRWGVMIHATAGFIDPGFNGEITLELSNVATLPVKLWPEMRIGQVSFMWLDEPAERPYGSPGLNSKYQGQRGPQPSQYGQNVRP